MTEYYKVDADELAQMFCIIALQHYVPPGHGIIIPAPESRFILKMAQSSVSVDNFNDRPEVPDYAVIPLSTDDDTKVYGPITTPEQLAEELGLPPEVVDEWKERHRKMKND